MILIPVNKELSGNQKLSYCSSPNSSQLGPKKHQRDSLFPSQDILESLVPAPRLPFLAAHDPVPLLHLPHPTHPPDHSRGPRRQGSCSLNERPRPVVVVTQEHEAFMLERDEVGSSSRSRSPDPQLGPCTESPPKGREALKGCSFTREP